MEKLLNVHEAAAYLRERGLKMQPDTLRKKTQRKEIPYYDLGRPKFKVADLESYIESKRVKANRWPSRKAV